MVMAQFPKAHGGGLDREPLRAKAVNDCLLSSRGSVGRDGYPCEPPARPWLSAPCGPNVARSGTLTQGITDAAGDRPDLALQPTWRRDRLAVTWAGTAGRGGGRPGWT